VRNWFSSDSLATADTKQQKTTSNAVLLFTDGQANVGMSQATDIVSDLKVALSTAPCMSVTTFGFGADHNAALLQSVAESSQGSYYYIKDTASVKESFADCLGGLISTVMSNVDVNIKCAPCCTIRKLLTKYTSTTQPDGSVTVSIKDLFSQEARDIPVELTIPSTTGSTVGAVLPLITLNLTYVSAFNQSKQHTTATSSTKLEAKKYTGPADVTVDEQRNRFLAAEAMEEARSAAEKQDFTFAKAKMDQLCNMVKASASASTKNTEMVMKDIVAAQSALVSNSAYSRGGSQAMNAALVRHQQQRCNDIDDDAAYGTAWKCSKKAQVRKC
jgi:hypothetical protein